MTRRRPLRESVLLDPETWSAPDHLSDDDFHVAAGPDWRRLAPTHDDLEDDR